MKSLVNKMPSLRFNPSTAMLLKGVLIAAILLTLTSILSGCSSSDYKYDYTVNGCDTGEHSFGNKSDYCSGLQNDTLNNGCAASTRQQTYQSECS
jgi:hypothetical protein